MKPQFIIPGLALAAMCAYIAPAEAATDPLTLLQNAQAALKSSQWAVVVKNVDELLATYGKPEVATQMGIEEHISWAVYWKGFALTKMDKHAEAIEVFKTCYETYAFPKNQYLWVSRFRIGEALFKLKKLDEAATVLENFLQKRPSNDRNAMSVPAVEVQNMLVICYFAATPPQLTKGAEGLDQMLKSRYNDKSPTPDDTIIFGVEEFFKAAQKENKVQDFYTFMNNHADAINLPGFRSAAFMPRIFAIASQCIEGVQLAKSQNNEALAATYLKLSNMFLGAIPDSEVVIGSIDSIVKTTLTPLKPTDAIKVDGAMINKFLLSNLKAYLVKLNTENKQVEGFALMQTARTQTFYGASRAARAAFLVVNSKYPKNPNREITLGQLSVLSAALDDSTASTEYIAQYMHEFPNGKFSDQFGMMNIQKAFNEKKYDKCIQECAKTKSLYAERQTSEQYLAALHFEMLSYYNLGDNAKTRDRCLELLALSKQAQEEKVDFDLKRFTVSTQYYLATCFMHDRIYAKALEAYDAYIKDNPVYDTKTNPMLPYVYYERALTYQHYSMEESNKGKEEPLLNSAIADLTSIESNFREHDVYPSAMSLLGTIYFSPPFSNLEKSTEAYTKAYEAASVFVKKDGRQGITPMRRVMSDAVYNLIMNASETKNTEAFDKYQNIFWTECDCPGNPSTIKVADVALKACTEPDAKYEASLKRMQDVIVREGRTTDANGNINPDVEGAVGSYTTVYMDMMKKAKKEISQKEIREHFYQFPGLQSDDYALKTILRMAVISVYQEKLAKEQNRDEKNKLASDIQVFYNELSRDFKLADMTESTLLNIGNSFIRGVGGNKDPKRAIPFFDEVISRNKPRFTAQAESGKAVAMGLSGDPALVQQAIAMMQKSLEKEKASAQPNTEALDETSFYLVQFYAQAKEYDKALTTSNEYLAAKYHKHAAEIQILQGDIYADQSKWDDALKCYIAVHNNYKGRVRYSGAALLKAMHVLYDKRHRGAPSPEPGQAVKGGDKHLAWNMGKAYLQVMQRNVDKMSSDDKKLIYELEDLVKTYGADNEVISDEKKIQERARLEREARGGN